MSKPRTYLPTNKELSKSIQEIWTGLASSREHAPDQTSSTSSVKFGSIHDALLAKHETWKIPETRALKLFQQLQKMKNPNENQQIRNMSRRSPSPFRGIPGYRAFSRGGQPTKTLNAPKKSNTNNNNKKSHDVAYDSDSGSVSSQGSLRSFFQRRRERSRSRQRRGDQSDDDASSVSSRGSFRNLFSKQTSPRHNNGAAKDEGRNMPKPATANVTHDTNSQIPKYSSGVKSGDCAGTKSNPTAIVRTPSRIPKYTPSSKVSSPATPIRPNENAEEFSNPTHASPPNTPLTTLSTPPTTPDSVVENENSKGASSTTKIDDPQNDGNNLFQPPSLQRNNHMDISSDQQCGEPAISIAVMDHSSTPGSPSRIVVPESNLIGVSKQSSKKSSPKVMGTVMGQVIVTEDVTNSLNDNDQRNDSESELFSTLIDHVGEASENEIVFGGEDTDAESVRSTLSNDEKEVQMTKEDTPLGEDHSESNSDNDEEEDKVASFLTWFLGLDRMDMTCDSDEDSESKEKRDTNNDNDTELESKSTSSSSGSRKMSSDTLMDLALQQASTPKLLHMEQEDDEKSECANHNNESENIQDHRNVEEKCAIESIEIHSASHGNESTNNDNNDGVSNMAPTVEAFNDTKKGYDEYENEGQTSKSSQVGTESSPLVESKQHKDCDDFEHDTRNRDDENSMRTASYQMKEEEENTEDVNENAEYVIEHELSLVVEDTAEIPLQIESQQAKNDEDFEQGEHSNEEENRNTSTIIQQEQLATVESATAESGQEQSKAVADLTTKDDGPKHHSSLTTTWERNTDEKVIGLEPTQTRKTTKHQATSITTEDPTSSSSSIANISLTSVSSFDGWSGEESSGSSSSSASPEENEEDDASDDASRATAVVNNATASNVEQSDDRAACNNGECEPRQEAQQNQYLKLVALQVLSDVRGAFSNEEQFNSEEDQNNMSKNRNHQISQNVLGMNLTVGEPRSLPTIEENSISDNDEGTVGNGDGIIGTRNHGGKSFSLFASSNNTPVRDEQTRQYFNDSKEMMMTAIDETTKNSAMVRTPTHTNQKLFYVLVAVVILLSFVGLIGFDNHITNNVLSGVNRDKMKLQISSTFPLWSSQLLSFSSATAEAESSSFLASVVNTAHKNKPQPKSSSLATSVNATPSLGDIFISPSLLMLPASSAERDEKNVDTRSGSDAKLEGAHPTPFLSFSSPTSFSKNQVMEENPSARLGEQDEWQRSAWLSNLSSTLSAALPQVQYTS